VLGDRLPRILAGHGLSSGAFKDETTRRVTAQIRRHPTDDVSPVMSAPRSSPYRAFMIVSQSLPSRPTWPSAMSRLGAFLVLTHCLVRENSGPASAMSHSGAWPPYGVVKLPRVI
jgi:hypothetical protein